MNTIDSRAVRAAMVTSLLASTFAVSAQEPLTALELLGKQVFFDEISSPVDAQSCASCHTLATGWTTPLSNTPVMPGAVSERFGNRKPPSNAYIVFSPVRDVANRTGGALWDARADGRRVRSIVGLEDVPDELFGPAADQSTMPFANPLEHNTTPAAVCRHVESAPYANLYVTAWGKPIDCGVGLEESFARIGIAIVSYEASREVSPFSSRFDAGALSPQERRGFDLFNTIGCEGCHSIGNGVQPGDGSNALFTGFRTFNIGVPRNPENPFYRMDIVVDDNGNIINPEGAAFTDIGDGSGRFKTPTLRNVGKRPSDGFVKRYMHNGFFNSLESVVHFYNTRDVLQRCPPGDVTVDQALAANCWPAPENAQNLSGAGDNGQGLGNLGLNGAEEAAIVAFLNTLSDNVNVDQPSLDSPVQLNPPVQQNPPAQEDPPVQPNPQARENPTRRRGGDADGRQQRRGAFEFRDGSRDGDRQQSRNSRSSEPTSRNSDRRGRRFEPAKGIIIRH